MTEAAASNPSSVRRRAFTPRRDRFDFEARKVKAGTAASLPVEDRPEAEPGRGPRGYDGSAMESALTELP